MNNKAISKIIDSDGPTPDQLSDSLLPRIFLNKSLEMSTFSHDASQNLDSEPNPGQVPQLTYRVYKDFHRTKRNFSINHRRESDLPKEHFLYHPERVKISPRAKVRIFTKNPAEDDKFAQRQLRDLKNKLRRLGKQTKALPCIHQKKETVLVDFPPAWTFAEKLCKLSELSPLSKYCL